MYWVFLSMTQMSASVTSRIWLVVRFMIPAKIELWFSRRNVEKAIAKISPIYFARSPVSILRATKFTVSLQSRGKRATSYCAAHATLGTMSPHRGVVHYIQHLVLLSL